MLFVKVLIVIIKRCLYVVDIFFDSCIFTLNIIFKPFKNLVSQLLVTFCLYLDNFIKL